MLTETYLLFFIFLLLSVGAVIAFSYFVIKPIQVYWAVKKARQVVASGEIKSKWQFENIFRILSTAGNDSEALYLWQHLQELKDSLNR